MPDRTRERTAIRRAHVPWSAYDAILRRTCLHIDAWLYQLPDDTLYFVLLASAGGVQDIGTTTYRAEPGALIPVANIPDIERVGLARQVGSPWARRNAPWLNALHWTHLQPMVREPHSEFKGHRSVLLHYVWSDARVDDPMAGLDNTYVGSGRHERALARMSDERREAEAARAVRVQDSKLDARERSIMRTLDKLLKG